MAGGDFHRDGVTLVIRTRTEAFIYRREEGATLREALLEEPFRVPLPEEPQGEAIAFGVEGGNLYTTSESRNQPIYHLTCVQ